MKTFFIALTTIVLFASCKDNTPQEQPTLPDNSYYKGTVSVAPGTPDAFTLENIEVEFTIAEGETTADIEMMKVKFAQAMPVSLDVLISGVTLTPTTNGYAISCDAEGIVPTAMNGRPFPDHIMTALTGTATVETLSISMVCGEFPMTFTGTRQLEI